MATPDRPTTALLDTYDRLPPRARVWPHVLTTHLTFGLHAVFSVLARAPHAVPTRRACRGADLLRRLLGDVHGLQLYHLGHRPGARGQERRDQVGRHGPHRQAQARLLWRRAQGGLHRLGPVHDRLLGDQTHAAAEGAPTARSPRRHRFRTLRPSSAGPRPRPSPHAPSLARIFTHFARAHLRRR